MNVSSVTSQSNNSSTTGNDNDLKQLLNQVKQLQTQIKTETQSKDDDKTKQAIIQLLQTQILQIQAQIQAKKSNQTNSTEQTIQTQPTISTDSKIDLLA